ncbi:MAG: sugar phosphate isomerase/epimerase family protein [Opitutales bacterium]
MKRSYTKKMACWLGGCALLLSSSLTGFAGSSHHFDIPDEYKISGFALGLQSYSFNRFTVMEAIEMTADAGGRVIELYPGQRLSPDQSDVQFNQHASDEVIAQVKAKLEEHDILPVNFGVVGLPNNEEQSRQVFEFVKKMGIPAITTEPSAEAMDLIEELVKEYDIMVAIHNHPDRPNDPSYQLWNPEYVLSLVEDRDSRLGACADIGHWIRSGITPVEGLQILEGRVVSLHIGDLHEFARGGHDVAFGTGVSDIPAVLEELERQDFQGHLSIEFEHNWDNNLPAVAQSVGFIRGWGQGREAARSE